MLKPLMPPRSRALTALLLLTCAASTPAQESTFHGQVVADADNRPIVNARIEIGRAGAASRIVALTDAFGRFTIPARAPASPLVVRKAGYAATRIVIAEGSPAVIRLRQSAAIAGRVVDEIGDPIIGAQVVAERRDNGAIIGRAATDDRGEYRLPVEPGVPVFVVATTGGAAGDITRVALTLSRSANGAVVRRMARPRTYRTYFPSAEAKADAAPLSLGAGEERPAIDFTIAATRAGGELSDAVPVATLSRAGEGVASGSISGRVVDGRGEPIANALVALVNERAAVGSYVERADADGRFAFADVPSGPLRLAASRPGYAGNDTRFVTTGQEPSRRDLEIRLSKWAALSGRVFDEFGDPVQGARIQLLRVGYEGGRRRLLQVGPAPQTDDRGAYRLYGLEPGEYMVSAHASEVGTSEMPGYVRTYYPGTSYAPEGQLVTAAQGSELYGIDLPLVRGQTFQVAGRLLDARGQSTTGGNVQLWRVQEPTAPIEPSSGAHIAADGTFVFPNVAPGQYVIQAYRGRRTSNGEGEFGALRVAVADADIKGLTLQTSAGSDISGTVVFDGSARPPSRAGIEIAAVPADADLAPATNWAVAGVGPDWRFSLQGVSGPRRLSVTRVPDGWSVRSIVAGGVDVTDRPVVFGTPRQSVTDVEIVLTDQVSELRGRVVDRAGRGEAGVQLALFSSDREKWHPGSRFMRRVATNDDGAFSVRGLPPDGYYVAEIPAGAQTGDGWRDPVLLDRLSGSGTFVRVSDGARIAVALTR